MNFISQSIPELFLIEPIIHKDSRGYFVETFKQALFDEAIGYKVNFVQDNESKSISRGVLRGLHFQSYPHTQGKLVRVIQGKVLDVAVDLRQESKTFGQHVSVALSEENKKQLFIPRGFAHGFIVLSESATISYKVDAYYAAKHNEGIAYNDTDINIDWGFSESEIILSEADKNYPTLAKSIKLF
ncbi:MAG: dTDP-4-dehydrorhamnose 3,5-epimerase [Alphaproteobacteria bacterium]|jgi:dTDP-4-dehydrorhamnose 3,5-epimerase|nr:dTDP-4-dehydrorhamnose 3,5-epimerase [Alphaproteobacteria bacterium]